MSGKTTQDHHNDGQRDGSEGTYNPPSGVVSTAIADLFFDQTQTREDRAAYDKGYDHGRSNRK